MLMNQKDTRQIIVFMESYFPYVNTVAPIMYKILKNIRSNKKIIYFKKKEGKHFPKWLLKESEKIQTIEISFLKDLSIENIILKKIINKFCINILFLKNFIKLLSKKYNVVITSTMPPGYHKYGYVFKIFNPNIKWIAFFSDPYSNSPFDEFNYKLKKDKLYFLRKIYFNYKKIKYKLDLKFRKIEEKLVFKYADKIIYISESQREFSYKGINKNNQTLVMPFYYLSEWKDRIIKNIKIKNRFNKNKINFVHPGNIYGNRNPNEFFKALKNFENEICYYNCGNFDDVIIEKYNLNKIVKSLGYIEYENLLENIKESDYIIIIDSFFKDIKNPYMPSKVVDAMYFDKPIIAITDKNTELDRFCKKTGNLSIENDSSKIEIKLKELIIKKIKIKPDYSMYCDLKFDII